ncbi:hypothetical protein [Variovorax sp. PAMC 28711]|uniref:hypothetical protein n=1 Tax=Variovorax sp. PAMC 28711 TaxID=1795631 RepID=UPI00078D41DE|nr:hypothetical protein [Variovorax sp. PAMC 28711]AMM24144.1 hypothetical protein AX767_07110 [Variovorax sp. PAMC 28711]
MKLLLAVLSCGLACVACTATASRFSAQDGWHVAVITRIDLAPQLPDADVQDCRPATSATTGTTVRYAEVAYHVFRRARLRVALLPAQGGYAVGDEVYVNVRDCAVPLAHAAPTR